MERSIPADFANYHINKLKLMGPGIINMYRSIWTKTKQSGQSKS